MMRIVRRLTILAALAQPLAAQDITGTVRDSASGLPVRGAVIVVLDSINRALSSALSNERGQYRVAYSGNARRLRAVRLGFRPRELPLSPSTQRLDIVMVSIPFLLEPVRIVASARCPKRDDRAAALSLLEQARAGLLATVVARSTNTANMTRLVFERAMDGTSDRISHQTVQIKYGATKESFTAAYGAADFVNQGFREDSAETQIYYAPDAEVLLDDGFAAGYCFHIMDPERRPPSWIGLAFKSADSRRGRIDIDGALWIDTVARALVDIQFRYVGLPAAVDVYRPGGRVSFREMANGVVLVDQFLLRLVAGKAIATRVLTDVETGSDGLFGFCRLARGTSVSVDVQREGMPSARESRLLVDRLTVIPIEMKPSP